MHFHYITYIATPQYKKPAPGVKKFPISVDPSLVIITLYLVCLNYTWKQRRRFFKEIMHFNCTTCMATLYQMNPCPGVMKCSIQVDPSLVIPDMHLVSLNYAQEKRRRFLKKYINFSLCTPKLPPLGQEVVKLISSCLFTLKMLHTKFHQDWPRIF